MSNYDDESLMKMINGFEDIKSSNYHTENAIFFATIHNQRVGEPYKRSVETAIREDGFESITGTLQEWFASFTKTVTNWFKDYDKQELVRIEKEVKGGLEAFQEASIKDATEALERFRKLVVERFSSYYDKIKGNSYLKGLSEKEAKEKILKEIDHTLTGLKNGKMKDMYLASMKKESEKYMLKIIAKIRNLKQTHARFKGMLDKKSVKEILEVSKFNMDYIDQLRTGGDKIIRKLESVDKNGTVYYDIVKSKIFVDVQDYIIHTNKVVASLTDVILSLDKTLVNDTESNSDVVKVNGKEFTAGALRTLLNDAFSYVDMACNAIYDFHKEVNSDVIKVSLATTGLPATLVDVFSSEGK